METVEAVSNVSREPWPDWYSVSKELALKVGSVPSIQFLRDDRPIVHLTHLPLLGVEVERPQGMICLDWFEPRPWQERGARFIASRRGTLLADVQRSGKTPTIIAAHNEADGPLVVVGPLSARSTWLKWMQKRWPDIEPAQLYGRFYNPKDIYSSPCLFVNYDVLSSWQSMGRLEIGTLVFDEAHLLASNRKSYRAQAAMFMSAHAVRRVAATGTPLWNNPADLWTILACLNPGAWGKYWDFAKRYCGAYTGTHGFELGVPTNVEELRLRLTEVMIRRTWEELMPDLPETRREIISLPITENVEREIEIACLSLRQEAQRVIPVGELARLRRVIARQKVEAAVDAASKVQGPVVVWTWHKDTAGEIAEHFMHGRACFTITGETAQTLREVRLDGWRRCPTGVLVATMGCAQAGVDLSHAADAVFAEIDWTPAVLGQAEFRTFSPERPMRVTYITINHHVEQTIVDTLRKKLHVADLVGMPAADTALDVIRKSFADDGGDLDRLKQAVLGKSNG